MTEITKEEWLRGQREELEKTIDSFTRKLSPEERENLIKKLTALHVFQWDVLQNITEEEDER